MTIQIEKMLDHILFLARRFSVSDAKYITEIIVLELGIHPKYDGYRYLVQSVVLYVNAPTHLSIKSLYAALEALYNGTVDADQVEQSIRSAIRKAWDNMDNPDVWSFYFGHNAKGEIEKPTNSDFISMIACVVGLWKGWCEDYRKNSQKREAVLL